MIKRILVLLPITLLCSGIYAQYSLGTTGMLNIPTAEMQETGTFMGGGNFLPKQINPERFKYNTGNYFIDFTFFSFLELTYRETLCKSDYMVKSTKLKQQDRSYSVRLRPLKEGKYYPAIVVGANDPIADKGANTYQSYYAVATKNFGLRGGHRIGVTIGYYLPGEKNNNAKYWGNQYDGIFGGICYVPAFCKQLRFMAEYDSAGFNIGASALLWKHLSLHVFTREFNCVSGGIRYECTLIH